jgi:hypothetical protein
VIDRMPAATAAMLTCCCCLPPAGASGQAITLVEDSDRVLVKEVVKKTRADLKARVVPGPVIQQWQAKVEGAERDVQAILR